MITPPWASASSSKPVGRPAKKWIRIEVSTATMTTGLLDVDVQTDLAAKSEGALEEPLPLHVLQAFDQRLSDPLARDSLSGIEKVR
jgi:hypothetical protein